jgi:hypothetical protein
MQPEWKPLLTAQGHRLSIAAALALLLGVLGTACGGNDDPNRVQIKPVNADITINSPGPGPVVFLERVGADKDLITIDVKLRLTGAQEFNGFNLNFHFDPTIVQFAGQMQVPEGDGRTFNPFGECQSASTYCGKYPAGRCSSMTGLCTAPAASVGTMCLQDTDCDLPATTGPVICQIPGDENVTGELFLGLLGDRNGQCDSYDLPVSVDVLLLRLAFNVTTNTTGTPLQLISRSQTGMSGDCAILDVNLVDLGIPCDDGMATITASR